MAVSCDLVALETGVTLEVASTPPEGGERCERVAFCLHPWSRLGGCMYDSTVQTMVRCLQGSGVHVVYYNSRGVGRSTGWPSLTGRTEGDDLAALVQRFLRARPHVRSVTFVGYSHGSLVVTLHPVLPPHIRTSHVLVSYPLAPRGLLTMFHSKTYSAALTSLLRDARARVLIVHGDRDEFTGRAQYHTWTRALETTEGVRAQLRILPVTGAGHFWHTEASRAVLTAALESWCSERAGA